MEIFRWVQKLSHLYKEEELMMKKLIPLRVQKVIMFIPFINIFIIAFWLYNYMKTTNNIKLFFKSLLKIWGVAIAYLIVSSALLEIFSQTKFLDYIRNFIMLYLLPFTLGYVLIKYQEKTIFKK